MKYREIKLGGGESIESAIATLATHKQRNELVFCEFNGQKLYSDTDDLESAYKKITGKTYAECKEADRKWQEEYQEEKRKHEAAIPELTKEWIEKGKSILNEEYHQKWAECVPIRLGDLYRGMELEACLAIVKELNVGCTLKSAKEIIDNQGHSGMSYGLVCAMVKAFCARGIEFDTYVNKQ